MSKMKSMRPDPNSRFSQGYFTPKHPNKYLGKYPIIYRSSWERDAMAMFDQHPSITGWSAEDIGIPYQSPIDGRIHTYYPDFMVQYLHKSGSVVVEMIEIKPRRETYLIEAKTKKDKIAFYLNQAKWNAAMMWCKKQGIKFRVMHAENLYSNIKR